MSDPDLLASKQKQLDIGLGGIGYAPGRRLRALNPSVVAELAKSFEEQGQLQPIVVRGSSFGIGYEIVAGVHRYEAAKKLKWDNIKAVMFEGDDDECVMAEIDENLVRGGLSPAERTLHLVRAKEIYERRFPETKVRASQAAGVKRAAAEGRIGKPGKIAPLSEEDRATKYPDLQAPYFKHMATITGLGKSTIRASLRPGKIPGIKKTVGTSLDKEAELQALAKRHTNKDPRVPQLIDRAASGENVTAIEENRSAEEFAAWLISHAKPEEIPTLIKWLRACTAYQVANFLRDEKKQLALPRKREEPASC